MEVQALFCQKKHYKGFWYFWNHIHLFVATLFVFLFGPFYSLVCCNLVYCHRWSFSFLCLLLLCLLSSLVLQSLVFPSRSHLPIPPGLWRLHSIKMTPLAKQIQTLGQKMLNWVGQFKTTCWNSVHKCYFETSF